MKNLLLLFILIIPFNVFSQINQKDLKGDWYSTNYQFTHSDTIHFYKNQHHFINEDSCALIHWKIQKKSFNSSIITNCGKFQGFVEPTNANYLKLSTTYLGQLLVIKTNNKTLHRYKIINNSTIKENGEFQLMRIDDLAEQQLYKRIDSLVLQVMNNDSTTVDTTSSNLQQQKPKPILVVNGVLQKDYEILKQYRLVEMVSISYIDKASTTKAFCKPISGAILIQVSTKQFKAISRRYN